MKKEIGLIIIFLIVFSITLYAKFQDIPVTRNLEPERFPATSFAEYQKNNPSKPTHFSEVSRKLVDNRTDENCLIIIEASIYPLISTAIATYQNDLLNEELNSFLVEFSGTSAEDMRDIIIAYYNTEEIVSSTLIGNLPSAWFEMFEDWNNNGIQDPDEDWVDFPIDLFFSDLDGIWMDMDSNGIYDYHEGSVHPDIALGRIKADNLDFSYYTEPEMIYNYFARNHFFRTESLGNPNNALAYIDDDWAGMSGIFLNALENLYSNVELIDDINTTTAEDYRTNRLPETFGFIQVHAHSSALHHSFFQNNGSQTENFYNHELQDINPNSYFYNLFACSNAHFETADNMGSLYLLANDHCLGVIGSTKAGSMLGFGDFYEPLYFRISIGEAFRQWWHKNVDTGEDTMWERSWFYGMVILGDPNLQVSYDTGNNIFVDVSNLGFEDGSQEFPFNTIQEGIDAAEFGNIVLVEDGIYFENIDFIGKAIIVKSINGYENCIIDGSQIGTVVTFENGEDSNSMLSGFTITNGSGHGWPNHTGGGIYCGYYSDPTLQDLLITNNYAPTRGGGIYLFYSDPIIDNIKITDNNYPTFGGGLYCFYSDPILKDTVISGNQSYLGGGIFCEHSNPVLINITIKNNSFGIYCTNHSNLSLSNVSILDNSSGGIYCIQNSNLIFDDSNRSSIYLNQSSANGRDLYSDQMIEVYIDTFTVMYPTDFYASPINNFIFDITNSVIIQTNSDLYVSPDGANTNNGLSFDEPLKTISYAKSIIQAASLNPHTIYLAPGIYSPNTNDESFPVYCISYVSFCGSGIEETVFDANHQTNVIYIDNVHDVSIEDIAIKNGSAGQGAGICCYDSNPSFANLLVHNNVSSYNGGGFYFNNSSLNLKNVLIYDNSANNDGGGIYCSNTSNPCLINVTITGNSASDNGGGIYCYYSSNPSLMNCILWNNTPDQIDGSFEISYSDIQGGWTGEGNIDKDPLFIGTGQHPYSLHEESPCIDAGNPDEIVLVLPWDIIDNFRIWNGNDDGMAIVDMGAYEFGAPVYDENIIVEPPLIKLYQNYPNPFNPSTTISFDTSRKNAKIIIYNIKGQKIKTFLINSSTHTPINSIIWDGKDDNNQPVSSGIYFYKLKAGKYTSTKKMILMK